MNIDYRGGQVDQPVRADRPVGAVDGVGDEQRQLARLVRPLRADLKVDATAGADAVVDAKITLELRREAERRAGRDDAVIVAVGDLERVDVRVGVGEPARDAEIANRAVEQVDLAATSRDFAGVGEARGDDAVDDVGVVRLEIVILGIVRGEIERQLAAEQRVLQPDFEGVAILGRDLVRAGEVQVVEDVERRPFVAARVGCVGDAGVAQVELRAGLAADVGVGCARLERNTVRYAAAQTAVVDTLVEVAADARPGERGHPAVEDVELIDREADTADQAEARGQVHRPLAEQCDIAEVRTKVSGAIGEGRRPGERARARHQRAGGDDRAGGEPADDVAPGEDALRLGVRVIEARDVSEEAGRRRGQAELLAVRLAGLRAEVVELLDADIRLRQPVAVARLGVGVVAVGGDRGERHRPGVDVGLERETIAGLVGVGDQVLVDGARVLAKQRRQDRSKQREVGRVDVSQRHPRWQRCGVSEARRAGNDLRAAIVVVLVIVGDERQADRLADVAFDDPAEAEVLETVDAVVDVRRDVEDVAVVLVVEPGQAAADRAAEREIDCAADAVFVAIAAEEACLDRSAKVAAGALRGDIDDAGAGVLAEQRPLRPAQNLEPLDVDEVAERLAGSAEDDAVEDSRNRRLTGDREGRGADAAEEQRLVERRPGFDEVERRHEILRAFEADLALRRERVAADHRHRERHVLQLLRPLLCGDDDVGRSVVSPGRRRSRGDRCRLGQRGRGDQQGSGQQQRTQRHRVILPMPGGRGDRPAEPDPEWRFAGQASRKQFARVRQPRMRMRNPPS